MMKNCNIFGVPWKIQVLGRGLMKNQYRGRNCLKGMEGGGLGQCVDLKRGLARKRGWSFWEGRGIDTPMHTMALIPPKGSERYHLNNPSNRKLMSSYKNDRLTKIS